MIKRRTIFFSFLFPSSRYFESRNNIDQRTNDHSCDANVSIPWTTSKFYYAGEKLISYSIVERWISSSPVFTISNRSSMRKSGAFTFHPNCMNVFVIVNRRRFALIMAAITSLDYCHRYRFD